MIAEPSIQKYIDIASGVVRGLKDEFADTRSGSIYETIFGSAAIIWSRQSQRNTDLFANTRFSTADGEALTDLVQLRYGIDRVLDAPGTGVATFQRPTASAGAGTVFKGTRVFVPASFSDPLAYYVSQDTHFAATDYAVEVPIEAAVAGYGTSIITTTDSVIDDSLWDSTIKCVALKCDHGTDFEQSNDFRVRTKAELRTNRVGFLDRIIATCADVAGAAHAVGFPSNRVQDFGTNVLYVGDANYTTSTALLNACKLALESVRILGDQLQVLPMTPSQLTITATVTLATAPANYDLEALTAILKSAIARYFTSTGGYAYSRVALLGAMRAVAPFMVQTVDFTLPASDVGLMVGLGFPGVLTRYFVDPNAINLSFQ